MNKLVLSGETIRVREIEGKRGNFCAFTLIHRSKSIMYIDCSCSEAERLKFNEGDNIMATGELGTTSYEKDGKKIYKSHFYIERVVK